MRQAHHYVRMRLLRILVFPRSGVFSSAGIKITNTRTTKITNNEGGAYDGNYIGDWEIRADAENKYRFTKD